jgi:hypothetical protein
MMGFLVPFLLILQLQTSYKATRRVGDTTAHRHQTHTTMTIAEVLKKYTDAWMAVEGVTGTGEGATSHGAPCIVVFVDSLTPTIRAHIPSSIEGHSIRFEQAGTIKAYPQGKPGAR